MFPNRNPRSHEENSLQLDVGGKLSAPVLGLQKKVLKLFATCVQVCEEEMCQEEVFPLSMNIMDRFLSMVRIRKGQIQLLGAVCLFLASKIRQTRPISAQKLVHYTDNSITCEELVVSGWFRILLCYAHVLFMFPLLVWGRMNEMLAFLERAGGVRGVHLRGSHRPDGLSF